MPREDCGLTGGGDPARAVGAHGRVAVDPLRHSTPGPGDMLKPSSGNRRQAGNADVQPPVSPPIGLP